MKKQELTKFLKDLPTRMKWGATQEEKKALKELKRIVEQTA